MQNAKDTFFHELRDRIAAINPLRTVSLRGVTRPAVVVSENELPGTIAPDIAPVDCFFLSWTALEVSTADPAPIVAMTCEIRYSTRGTPESGGLDRGRTLAAMDAELAGALTQVPQHSQKQNFAPTATGAAPLALGSRIWWSAPAFTAAIATAETLARSATLTLWSFQEAGEA